VDPGQNLYRGCGPKSIRLAAMRAGYGGKTAIPYAAFEASLCERFHCLPSQLDDANAARLLQGIELLGIFELFQKMGEGIKLNSQERKLQGELLQLELEQEKR